MRSEQDVRDAINKYSDMIRRICFVHLKNHSDVEDIFQDVFLKYATSSQEFKSSEHEKAWFIVATNNYCKNKVKHWWNKTKELDFDISEEIKNDETLEKVLNLPDKFKIPIYMHYYEGYSCNEIAKMLKTKENTVYSYLHRGRLLLKDMIEGDLNE